MRALELARQWNREGLLSEDALAKLEARYVKETGGTVTTALLAGAGAVLAAAIIAVAFLAEFEPSSVRLYFLITGLAVGTVGVVLWLRSKWQELAEGLAVTTGALLIPASLMYQFDGPQTPFLAFGVALLGALAMAAPARSAIVATVGAAALYLGIVAPATDLLANGGGTGIWLALAAVMVAVAFWTQKHEVWADRHAILNLAAPVVLAAASIAWWGEVIEPVVNFQASGELVVALFQIPVLALAFTWRERPILMGSVAVLAVDAIVFGFDIGQLFVGIPMLLLVAGGLVWLAIWANRDA